MKRKQKLFLVLVILQFSCADQSMNSNYEFTDLTGEYLGQEKPVTEPKMFPPEILVGDHTWLWHGPPVFSPDGKEMYYCKYTRSSQGDHINIHYMMMVNNRWTIPQKASFSEHNGDFNPCFSYDGNKLFFISGRQGGPFFSMEKTENGWSSPQSLDITIPFSHNLGHQMSVAKNGTIYFDADHKSNYEKIDILKTVTVNGNYIQPESVGNLINLDCHNCMPYIDPDENYLIFSSNRSGGYGGHDLYISFKKTDGTWNEPRNMGDKINTDGEEAFPWVSFDGKFFFFVSNKNAVARTMNPFWIDARIIDDLR